RVAKLLLHLFAQMPAVAHAVGHPGQIDLAEQVEVGPARPRRLLDPRRTGAKVVSAVDHGAEQIGVLHDDPTRPRDVFILEGDLAAGDRAVVGVFDRRALSFGEAAHEFRYALGAVARGQLHGERRLAGRLRAGEN